MIRVAIAWIAGMTSVRLLQGLIFGLVLAPADPDRSRGGEPGEVVSGILLVVALFAGKSNSALSNYMQLFLLAIIAVIVVDGLLLRRSIMKVVGERLPSESTRGLALYAIMRALQLRRYLPGGDQILRARLHRPAG